MDMALMNSAQTLALYSPDYIKDTAVYSRAEHYASWWQEPGGDARKLIPIVLRETPFTPLMAVISRIEVKGTTPDEAAAQVVERLKTPKEIESRDHARAGLPLPKIFNAAYRPNPNFTGRFEAMESLQKALRGGNAAVTAVAGMGGVGKTTLAAEYCHRFGGRYGGVWWVRADQEPVMLADLQTLGQRLGVVEGKNTEVDARATLDHLASRTEPWLLVYDNAPNPDAVTKWLPTGAVRCLITSRFTEFGGIAPVTRIDQWSDEVTAGYLLSRTERDDAAGAARLAKSLGGLPLAAEQAAVYLRPRAGVSYDDYAAEIASLIKRKKDAGITGDYPDTVYAGFVKSIETLGQTETGKAGLDILRLCAFLSPGGVDLRLLTTRSDEVLPESLAACIADKSAREDCLAALTSLSLLRQEDGPAGPILTFHRLLLEVARDWMGEDNRALWGGAAVQLVARTLPGTPDKNPSNDPSLWSLYARLMPHVAALDAHAPRTGLAARALGRLFNLGALYLTARGDREGALALAERCVALLRVTRAEPLQLANGLGVLGNRYIDVGRLDDAEAAAREVLEVQESRLNRNDPSIAIALSNLAHVYLKRENFAAAEPLFLRAADIEKAAHGTETATYGKRLGHLDNLYDGWAELSGDVEKRRSAARYSTQALSVTRASRGARHPETSTRHFNLAVLKARLGERRAAVEEAERALAIMLSLDLAQHPDTQHIASGLVNLSESDKAARLRSGDISDLLPVIAQIEAEHRAWVAKDPKNRHFGPPSPFADQRP
jgi:tetratricopeptide (TPR) repeat protein